MPEFEPALGEPKALLDLLHGAGSYWFPKSALDRASSPTDSAGLCGFHGSAQTCTPCLRKLIVKSPLPEIMMGGASGQGCDRQEYGCFEPRNGGWGEGRADLTPGFLGKELPSTIPLETGSLILGRDAPQRGGQRKERREKVCFSGAWTCLHALRGTHAEQKAHRRLKLVFPLLVL